MEVVRQDANGRRYIVYCCDRCGKVTEGVHTCSPNPVIEQLRATIEQQQARIKELESDPAIHFAHRFAVVLECMTHSEYPNDFWNEATTLLSEYHEAQDKWREAMGEPYVSGFGKD